jgi:hypothetical protein
VKKESSKSTGSTYGGDLMVELSDTTPFLTFVGWLLRRFCYIFNDSNNISHFEWLELPDKRLVRLPMPFCSFVALMQMDLPFFIATQIPILPNDPRINDIPMNARNHLNTRQFESRQGTR